MSATASLKYQPRQAGSTETARGISIYVEGTGENGFDTLEEEADAIIAAPEKEVPARPAGSINVGDQADLWAEPESAANTADPRVFEPVVRVPSPAAPPHTFRLLQQWEGTVTAVDVNEFVAELRDLTDPALPREEATFDLEEVSPGDMSLLVLGALFRWNVGYRTNTEGQRERVSQMRFVRIPGWRKSLVEEVQRSAAALMENFPLGDDDRAPA